VRWRPGRVLRCTIVITAAPTHDNLLPLLSRHQDGELAVEAATGRYVARHFAARARRVRATTRTEHRPMNPIVIVGGGHAGAQLCSALAEAGLAAQVHLVCEEPVVPYQRPPLSKTAIKTIDEPLQWHRAAEWYAEKGVTLHLADAAVAIDRGARKLRLQSGRELDYGTLVLATGARGRTIPGWPAALENVAVVRQAADAARLAPLLAAASSLTVIGGGFIGLEVAACAHGMGKRVRVIEVAPRLLGRAVSPTLSAHVLDVHRASGIDVAVGAQLAAIGDGDVVGERLVSLTVDGRKEPAELVVVGIGATPDVKLAQDAGLACDNGIAVDASMRTSDGHILAIGDCTNFPAHALAPSANGRLRLESVQNASDQARTAALTIQGQAAEYRALPWFWSDQGGLRLQMAGLLPVAADAQAASRITMHRRPGAKPESFSLLHYDGARLACVESVNAPMDHVASRKLVERGSTLAPEVACDPAVALKKHV
jgi:3-phenylpropionate/trans-cinnamate dioxygenase ferredoxin reductase component